MALKGELYVAGPFGKEQIESIKAHFTELLGEEVEFDVRRNESLIGGFMAMINGKVYDSSVAFRIKEAQHSMISNQGGSMSAEFVSEDVKQTGVGTVPGTAADADVVISHKALLARPGAVASCAAFLIYCGVEYVTGLWSSTYFVSVRGVAPETAASWASLFYFGIMTGRLLSGFAAMKLSDRALIRIGEGTALFGLVVLLLPLSDAFQVAGLALVGLGCAPLFPAMLDETPELFGKRYSQGLMGLQFAGAYIGGTLLPPLFGWLSPVIGLGAWPVYLLILMAAFTLVTEQKQRACARKEDVLA